TFYWPYAQRLDVAGAAQWGANGVRVEVTGPGTNAPAAPPIASDLSGGIVLSGTSGLQRVLGDGRPGWAPTFTPRITGIRDVPGDQGGSVLLEFTGPYAEVAPYSPSISTYEVWRKITPPVMAPGQAVIEGAAGPRDAAASAPPVGWELLTSFSPDGDTA